MEKRLNLDAGPGYTPIMLASHLFVSVFLGKDGTILGGECAHCAKIVPFKEGKLPNDVLQEECPGKPADGLCESLPCTRRDDD